MSLIFTRVRRSAGSVIELRKDQCCVASIDFSIWLKASEILIRCKKLQVVKKKAHIEKTVYFSAKIVAPAYSNFRGKRTVSICTMARSM